MTQRSAYGAPHKRLAQQAFTLAGAHWAGEGACEVSRVELLGDGLSRTAWYGDIDISPDPRELSGIYVALVPREADVTDRAEREATILNALGTLDLPIRVPRRGVMVDVHGRPVLVREYIRGVPVDSLPKGDERRWLTIARAAAAIHGVDASIIAGPATRREHALARFEACLGGISHPVIDATRAWCLDHLPPDLPSCLLHGDLLGQNVLFGLHEADGVIDWEHGQRGDPAYDLAIVTRGRKRPFKVDDSFELLLEAYADAGGQQIRRSDVRFHELCLFGAWYAAALDGDGTDPAERLADLEKLLARTVRESASDRRVAP